MLQKPQASHSVLEVRHPAQVNVTTADEQATAASTVQQQLTRKFRSSKPRSVQSAAPSWANHLTVLFNYIATSSTDEFAWLNMEPSGQQGNGEGPSAQ